MATQTVIRAGESAPQANLDVLKSKDSKTFYHMVPGAPLALIKYLLSFYVCIRRTIQLH